jgi:hypothetical protein
LRGIIKPEPRRAYYAVATNGRRTGVFDDTYSEVHPLVDGFPGAVCMAFWTAAEAQRWFDGELAARAVRGSAPFTAGRLRDDRAPTQMPGASAVAILANIGAADIQLGVGLQSCMTQRGRHVDSSSASVVSHAAASSQALPLRDSSTDSGSLDGFVIQTTFRQSRLAEVLASAGLQRLPQKKAPDDNAAVNTAGWPTGVPNASAHRQSYSNESVGVSAVAADPPDENRQPACSTYGDGDRHSAE